MAGKKKEEKKYIIKVVTNPDFTGTDAGNVAFAHGEAIISDERMVSWFEEHEGYEVSEVKDAPDAPDVSETHDKTAK